MVEEGNHFILITYWKDFECHEESHKDKIVMNSFEEILEFLKDTKELGYKLEWQD